MKNLLFTCSLVANAALLAMVVSGRMATSSIKRAETPLTGSGAVESQTAKGAELKTLPPPVVDAPPAVASAFSGLFTRLQAAGLSPELARFATTAAVKQSFAERRRTLGIGYDPTNFTKTPITSASSESPETRAMKASVDEEERQQLEALFGVQPEYSLDTQRRLFEGLQEEKAGKLRRIISDYRTMQAQISAGSVSRGSSNVRENMALLEKEKRVDIERLLSADELLTYDLRNSSAASALRNHLGKFEATEAEFRALYPVFDAAEKSKAAGMRADVEGDVRRILGEARYAEIREARALSERQVQAFIEARAFVVSRNLFPDVANQLLWLQAEYQPRLAVLEQARSASPAEREAQIAELRVAAQTKIKGLFGEDGLKAYLTSNGTWLDAASAGKTRTP